MTSTSEGAAPAVPEAGSRHTAFRTGPHPTVPRPGRTPRAPRPGTTAPHPTGEGMP